MTTVLLAVSGGIAAYKTPELVRLLKKQKMDVTVVMSKSSETFVTPTALAVVSEQRVWTDLDRLDPTSPHLKLSKSSDILLIAPATANTIAKCAYGIADNLLTMLYLSFKGQVIIAPAMHTEMWENAATQENIAKLRDRGVWIIDPVDGDLASGDFGVGRLADLEWIVESVQMLKYPRLNLKGKKIVITSGGTTETIDPVRVLSNKSSGKLGLSLAKRAHFEGADVRFLTTKPVSHPGFSKVLEVLDVAALNEAVQSEVSEADVLYMAAAVSDFTVKPSSKKMSRNETTSLTLEKTDDILGSLKKDPKKTYVGFCLADDNLDTIAKEKLSKKGLDYIVGNKSESFGKELRSIQILSKEGFNKSFTDITLNDVSQELLSLID
jgi:phosphopantothenoylcysteine decarboxylase / phosphopantothenate---cysteine ligase